MRVPEHPPVRVSVTRDGYGDDIVILDSTDTPLLKMWDASPASEQLAYTIMYALNAHVERVTKKFGNVFAVGSKGGLVHKELVKKRKPRCKICRSRVAAADGRCNHRDCVPF